MDAQSNVRLFDSVLSNECAVDKIGAIKDLQLLCFKLSAQDKTGVLACLPAGYGKKFDLSSLAHSP